MNELSRRTLLRASAGAAAVAVPMAALSGSPAFAATDADDADLDSGQSLGSAPVMFCIHDADRGEVSVLHGESEVIVQDRRLVAKIMKAASVRQSS